MIKCPPASVWEQLLSGESPENQQKELESHLATCAKCRAELERLSQDDQVEQLLRVERAAAETVSQQGDSSPESETIESQLEDASSVQRFGEYELLGEIARGGMGVVYKARQLRLDRTVALKMILAGQFADQEEEERFLAEAQAAANLDHPGIVPVFESGEHDGRLYFSMAFIEGSSLAQRISKQPLPPAEAAQLTEKIAEAVAYAHQRGVIHRDLKPANVLIDETGQPRVTDFGLAKRLDADSEVTRTGKVMGTPAYMSPEQAAGDTARVGPLSDVYSLGATLYCLLTSRPPFQAANPIDTLLQVKDEDPVPPRRLNSIIPRDLETICLKCLEKDPPRRYESATALAEDLGRFLRAEPVQARRITALGRTWRWCRRRPGVASLLAGVAALLVALAIGAAITSASIARSRAETHARLEGEYVGDIRFASRAWKSGDVAGVKQLLESHLPAEGMPDRRGFEWYYLRRLVDEFQPFMSLGDQPSDLACSPRGNYLAAATASGPVSIWSLDTGAKVCSLQPTGSIGGVGVQFNAQDDGFLINRIIPGGAAEKAGLQVNDKIVGVVKDGAAVQVNRYNAAQVFAMIPGEPNTKVELEIRRRGADQPQRITLTRGTIPIYSPVGRIAFSPDGRRLVASHADGQLRLWDAQSGKLEWSETMDPNRFASDFAVSPDGTKLAAALMSPQSRGSADRVVVWSLAQRKRIGELNLPSGQTFSTAWSADGRRIAVGGANVVHLFDPTSLKSAVSVRVKGAPESIRFSPDSRIMAVRSGNAVHVWDTKDRIQRTVVEGNVRAIAFSRRNVLAVARGQTVEIWDIRSVRRLRTIRGHTQNVSRLSFAQDGRLVTCDSQGQVGLWDVAEDQDSKRLALHVQRIGGLEFTPDNRTIAIAAGKRLFDRHGQLMLVDGFAGRRAVDPSSGRSPTADGLKEQEQALVRRELNSTNVRQVPACVAVSPDGKRLIAGMTGGRVEVWNIATRKLEKSLTELHEALVTCVACSPDGRLAATGSGTGRFDPGPHQNGKLVIWDLETGAVQTEIREGDAAFVSVVFSPDRQSVFTVARPSNRRQPSEVTRWDVEAGSAQHRYQAKHANGNDAPVHAAAVALSPDGRYLAAGGGGSAFYVWDAQSGETLRLQQNAHGGAIRRVVFSPDGRTMATSGDDWKIRLWRVGNWQELLVLEGHRGTVMDIAFSRDGQWLASGEGDLLKTMGEVRLWRAGTKQNASPEIKP